MTQFQFEEVFRKKKSEKILFNLNKNQFTSDLNVFHRGFDFRNDIVQSLT